MKTLKRSFGFILALSLPLFIVSCNNDDDKPDKPVPVTVKGSTFYFNGGSYVISTSDENATSIIRQSDFWSDEPANETYTMTFKTDGTYVTMYGDELGTYQVAGNTLLLHDNHWGELTATLSADGFIYDIDVTSNLQGEIQQGKFEGVPASVVVHSAIRTENWKKQ